MQCVPCSSQGLSEILPEIHLMKKWDFLFVFFKPIIHSQVIQFSGVKQASVIHHTLALFY